MARAGLRSPSRRPRAAVLLALVPVLLLAGLAGGLLRAGALPGAGGEWLGQAAAWHGALMLGGFMGTVVGIERAVALRHPTAWLAPVASLAGGLALLSGEPEIGFALLAIASLAAVAAHVLLVRRQPAAHTALLLVGVVAWLAGNLLQLAGMPGEAVLPAWFAFLLLTVTAERLEMTRLMRRRPLARPALYAIVGLLLGACALGIVLPQAGGVAFGLACVLLAAWLFAFDVARRTLAAPGLPRYMAACLLGGYGWLALGGIAWAATAAGWSLRDAALHAIALGFLGSMVLGHAPVILPAVARIKLQHGPAFWLPLAALHLTLLARLGPGTVLPAWRAAGAMGNALALAAFAAVAFAAARQWKRLHAAEDNGRDAVPTRVLRPPRSS